MKGSIITFFPPYNVARMVLWLIKSPSFWHPFPVIPCMPYKWITLLMPPIQLLFHYRLMELPMILMQENLLQKRMRIHVYSSRTYLHHGIHCALSLTRWDGVCLTRWDILLPLPLQWGDSYLSTLSHCMPMMLQMDDNNFATVLENVIIISSKVPPVYTEKVPALDHLVLAKMRCISPKKDLLWFGTPCSMRFAECCNHT